MEIDYIEANDIKYAVKIYYEKRNNSRVSVSKKAVSIRIPIFWGRGEIFREIVRMKQWAKNRLLENPDRFKPEVQREYHNGEVLKIENDEYKVSIELKDKKNSSAKILENNTIELSIPRKLSKETQNLHISKLVSKCIAHKRLPKLKEKLAKLNNTHFNQKINNISFKNTSSRWGSCSRGGNINISTRLLFAPDDVLEYVCIHELAHLIEHNHSRRFWALVERVMPDYKEKELWLKECGGSCKF